MNVIELSSENGSPTSKLFIRSLFVVSTRSNILLHPMMIPAEGIKNSRRESKKIYRSATLVGG